MQGGVWHQFRADPQRLTVRGGLGCGYGEPIHHVVARTVGFAICWGEQK